MSFRHHTFITIIAAITAAASIALTACSKRDVSRDDTSGRDSDSAVVATSASNPAVVVREAGLRFDPPSTWPRDRYRVDVKSGADADQQQPNATHWVALQYRPESDADENSLCRFIVFSRDAWTRIENETGPPIGTMVDTIDGWVYIAQLPQSNPYSPESLDGPQFDAMRLSIREVRARFAIEGEGPAVVRDSDPGEL